MSVFIHIFKVVGSETTITSSAAMLKKADHLPAIKRGARWKGRKLVACCEAA